MKRALGLVGLLIVLLHSPLKAYAECTRLTVTVQQSSYSLEFNASPELELVVTRTGSGGCSFFIGFSKGHEATYDRSLRHGNDAIHYQLYRAFPYQNVLKDLPEASNSLDVLSGSFPEGIATPSALSLTFRLSLGQLPDPLPEGTYHDKIDINLYQGTLGGAYSLSDSKNATYSYNVSSKVSLSLVAPGAPYDQHSTTRAFNFGMLTEGQSQSADLILVYNSGFNLYFSSANNGSLRHIAAASYVPYILKIDGIEQSLAETSTASVLVASGAGTSPPQGTRYPLSVSIGKVSGVAGAYTDIITISVVSP